ncbi:hypothetical protein J6O48_01840 [bacterium]|nr:hypothetical protein [bacterium]
MRSKYIIFILCHEIYHQIYRHREAAERKTETANGNNHFLANIAMDVEINRDLERQFPSIFNNVTEEIGGCFDTRFPSETWEPIFDAYYTGETPLPNTKKFNSQIKPAKVTKKDNSGSGGGSQKFPPDYVKGYEDAIQDVIDGKVDPLTYPINEPTSQYEEGYNAAIE